MHGKVIEAKSNSNNFIKSSTPFLKFLKMQWENTEVSFLQNFHVQRNVKEVKDLKCCFELQIIHLFSLKSSKLSSKIFLKFCFFVNAILGVKKQIFTIGQNLGCYSSP